MLISYLLSCSVSFAQSVSIQNPDSVFSIGPGINWLGEWSEEEFNATHLLADDNSKLFVETCPNEPSDTLFITNFGFDIPEGSQISNVKVTVVKSGYGSNDDVKDKLFILGTKNGGFIGNDQSKPEYFSADDSTYIYEGGSVKWGVDFTPEIINDPNFGIYILVESFVYCRGVELDFFQIEVEYDNLTGAALNLEPDFNLTVFPNPSNNQLYIQNTEEIKEFKIFDLNGNSYSTDISRGVIDIEELTAGHYILHIVSNNETEIVPFIKINSTNN